MKVYEIKRKEGILYVPNSWTTEILKSGTLKYFIHGEGYLKTKSFRLLPDVELPDRWSKMSWLEICKIHEKYGIEISNEYADCKVAGIISRQTIKGKYSLYQKIKDIIPENFESFFEILPCDYMLSCFGIYFFDIIALDKILSKLDSDYNDEHATYLGQSISMCEYITLKYGSEYTKVIKTLIDLP